MKEEKWTMIIRPKRRWLDIDLRELWRYRDLWYMYVKRDIIVVYKQTILGPLWFLIQPLFTTIIYMFVFGGLAGISTDGVPQPLFYMSGIMLWNYFNSVFNSTSTLFVQNSSVFGKVYFHRLVVPLANATSNLVKFLIQLGLFLAIYAYFLCRGMQPSITWAVVLLPLLVMLVGIFSIAWGMIMSSVTTKYRDLTLLITFGIQLFMYATPVIYPMSAAPDKYRAILQLNPLSPVFEAFRYGCLGCGSLEVSGLFYAVAFTLLSLFCAVLIFNRVERVFMDTV